MKKNIKDILNETDATSETPLLPKGHRAEFLAKLSSTENGSTRKETTFYWKSIAAACVFLLGISAFIYLNYDNSATDESPLFAEMTAIEKEYLAHIATEWESFQTTTTDAYLVEKYRERLHVLDASYQELKQEFLVQKNSLTVLDKMIQNLQMRLTLLQEIQQHLKRLQDEQQTI